jgi:hypothetical protein
MIADEGVMALALALREGRLGGRLKKLWFLECLEDEGDLDEPSITDVSVVALAEALVAGKQCVTQLAELRIKAHRMTTKGVQTLVEAAVSHCPKLKRLWLSKRCIKEEGDGEALRALGRAKGVKIDFS